MPEFLITSPDGRKFRVTAPEGAKQEEVLSRVRDYAEQNPPQQAAPPAAAPEPAPQAPAAPQKSSGGVIGQGLKGALEGALSLPTNIYRDILGIATGQKQPTGPPQLGAPPQNKGEEYARSVGQAVGNPQSYLGPAGAVPKVLGAIGGGLGAQAGGDIGGTPGAIIGGIAGGALGGGLVKPKAPVSNVPTRAEIAASAKARYKDLTDNPVPLHPADMTTVAQAAQQQLRADGFFKEDQPRTFRAISRLEDPTHPPDTVSLNAIRTSLTHIQKDAHLHPSDAAAAKVALQELDNYIANLPGISGKTAAARGDYRAAKTSERLEEAQDRGKLRAGTQQTIGNEDVGIRQQIRALAESPKFPKTPEVEAELERIATSNDRHLIVKALNALGTFGLKHFLPTREIADYLAKKNTAGRIAALDELIRLQSPLAKQRGSTPTPKAPTRLGGAGLGAARQVTPKDNRLYDE